MPNEKITGQDDEKCSFPATENKSAVLWKRDRQQVSVYYEPSPPRRIEHQALFPIAETAGVGETFSQNLCEISFVDERRKGW